MQKFVCALVLCFAFSFSADAAHVVSMRQRVRVGAGVRAPRVLSYSAARCTMTNGVRVCR